MADQTDKEKLEAATKAAEKAKAEAHAKPIPEHLKEDYTGPLTCDQAAARIEHLQLHGRKHIGDLSAYENKPAQAEGAKGTK